MTAYERLQQALRNKELARQAMSQAIRDTDLKTAVAVFQTVQRKVEAARHEARIEQGYVD